MNNEKTILQLESLAEDRKSFFCKNGDDDVFRKDHMALEIAISTIKELDKAKIAIDLLSEDPGITSIYIMYA